MADTKTTDGDDLDAFFSAAKSENPGDIASAAASIHKSEPQKDVVDTHEIDEIVGDLDGQFIAYDPEALGQAVAEGGDPLVLIPANIHSYMPWWGWVAIGVGLVMLVLGVMLMPGFTLNRLATRLDDTNQANVQYAMRQLVMRGDERTVKKLYSLAASPETRVATRLRAIDAMSLINQVPEVDRALLRLELSGSTDDQIREAAIAARKQREAARTRRRRP